MKLYHIRIFKEKVLLVFMVLSLILMIFSLGLVYFNINKLGSPLILHFDEFRGVDFFGEGKNLWGIWLTGFVAIAINTFLANTFFYRERALTYLLIGSSFLLSILTLVILATIISVN